MGDQGPVGGLDRRLEAAGAGQGAGAAVDHANGLEIAQGGMIEHCGGLGEPLLDHQGLGETDPTLDIERAMPFEDLGHDLDGLAVPAPPGLFELGPQGVRVGLVQGLAALGQRRHVLADGGVEGAVGRLVRNPPGRRLGHRF